LKNREETQKDNSKYPNRAGADLNVSSNIKLLQFPVTFQKNQCLIGTEPYPLIHIHCEIKYDSRNLQPICRKYFKNEYKIQIVKFKNNLDVNTNLVKTVILDTFDGLPNHWPLSYPNFNAFFTEFHIQEAPMGNQIGPLQHYILNKWGEVHLFYITDIYTLTEEMAKSKFSGIPNLVFLYDYTINHYEIYKKLETEFVELIKMMYFSEEYSNKKLMSKVGVYLIDMANCDAYRKCRQIRNALMVPYTNAVLTCIFMTDCRILPLNVKMQYSGAAFKHTDAFTHVFNHYDLDSAVQSIKSLPELTKLYSGQERMRQRPVSYSSKYFSKVNLKTFDPRNYKNCIIVYTADHCVHCHDMKQKFENVAYRLQKSYRFFHLKTDISTFIKPGTNTIVNLNIDVHTTITEKLKFPFDGFPKFYVFKNGLQSECKMAQKNCKNIKKFKIDIDLMNVWMLEEDGMIEKLKL